MRTCVLKSVLVTVLLGMVGLPATTFAQRFKIMTFDVPGAGTTPGAAFCGNNLLTGCSGTTPMANNNAGEIVGIYITDSGVYYGFLRSTEGKVTIVSEPNADTTPGDFNGTYPFSINSWGAVTGFYQNTSEVLYGFIREPNGTYLEVDDPDAGTAAFQGTWPTTINDKGEIAGFYIDGSGNYHGFVRNCEGKFTTLDDPSANGGTVVALEQGLNVKGAVVGWYFAGPNQYGFSADGDGTFHNIEPSSAAPYTFVGGINNSGALTGYFVESNGYSSGYLRRANGSTTIFNVEGPDGVQGTAAFSLNASDEVTGVAIDENGANHGFVRFSNGVIRTFDAEKAGRGNFQGTRPTTINTAGQVIGYVLDADNVSHGFILWPEPAE